MITSADMTSPMTRPLGLIVSRPWPVILPRISPSIRIAPSKLMSPLMLRAAAKTDSAGPASTAGGGGGCTADPFLGGAMTATSFRPLSFPNMDIFLPSDYLHSDEAGGGSERQGSPNHSPTPASF